MKHFGITDVLLCWGVDLAGIVTRPADTKQSMEWAHKAGIGVYLIVWQPSANSLPRTPNSCRSTRTVNSCRRSTPSTRNGARRSGRAFCNKSRSFTAVNRPWRVMCSMIRSAPPTFVTESMKRRPSASRCRANRAMRAGRNGRKPARAGGRIGRRIPSNTFVKSIRIGR